MLRKTKTKNSILRLKSAGEPSQRASQTFLLPTGGVYLKKSELILRAIGSAGGIPPEPPFRPPRLEAEAKRQTAKEPEKMLARTLFWPEAGFSLFLLKMLYSSLAYYIMEYNI